MATDEIGRSTINFPARRVDSLLAKSPMSDENLVCSPESPYAEDQSQFITEKRINDTFSETVKKGSEKVIERIEEISRVLPFAGGATPGKVTADLKIGVVDKNGFLDYGEQDLKIKAEGKINVKKDTFFGSLKSLEGKPIQRSWSADVDIGKVNFDPKSLSYKIELKIDGLLFANDNINLVVKTDKQNNLFMTVEDKWLPDFIKSDKDILKQAMGKIAKELKKADFGLETMIAGEKLYFLPKVEKQTLKISNNESLRIDSANVNFENTKFKIQKNGDLEIELKSLAVTASNLGFDEKGKPIGEKTAGDADSSDFEFSANIDPSGTKEIILKEGSIKTHLDQEESKTIEVHDTSFDRHFQSSAISLENLSGKMTLDKQNQVVSSLGGKISVALNRHKNGIKMDGILATDFNSGGDISIKAKNLTVTHGNGVSKIEKLLVSRNKTEGLKFFIEENVKDLPNLEMKTTKNDLSLIIGTDKFQEVFFDRLKKAKESIHIESYLYSGEIAKKIADQLLLKSAGLEQSSNGKLKINLPDGVKVRLIFDSSLGDETPETHKSMKMLKDKYDEFVGEAKNGSGKFANLAKADREKVIANVEKNMQWKLLDGGISRVDHRKVTVIDGKNALTGGGINLTDSAMTKHDMMMDIWGPEVKSFQREFIENWEEVAGKIPEAEKKAVLKDESTLIKAMKKHQEETGKTHLNSAQVLVTDDHQSQIYQKMIQEVRSAKKEINIEHAYFTDARMVKEVGDAIRRGVNVKVILPEYSDEGDIIHYGNLATLQDLKRIAEESGKDNFKAYLYKWDEKNNTGKFNHTKAMTFDGKTAIVGSANLTTRSMTGTLQSFLYNREMSVFVDDPKFVKDLNKNLIDKDIKPEWSKELDDQWFSNLVKDQQKIDKYKALQPLF